MSKRLSLCIRASRYPVSHRAMKNTCKDTHFEVDRREPRAACSHSVRGLVGCEVWPRPVWKDLQNECAVAGVWDRLVEYIDDELVNVQALRAVCRGFVTEATAEALCHLAFHEKEDIMLDPHSDPRSPIWKRCIALYSHSM